MSDKKQGFASFSPHYHRAVSSKGGKAKVPKGFASMSPRQRIENGRKGGLARKANIANKRKEKYGKDTIPSGNEGTNP